MYRAKLCAPSADSTEDIGAGLALIVNSTGDGSEGYRLVFRREDTGEVLRDRSIFSSGAYQLRGEGESIIAWEDLESQKEWALSSQNFEGAANMREARRIGEHGSEAEGSESD